MFASRSGRACASTQGSATPFSLRSFLTTSLVLVATFMLSGVLAAQADAAESANLDQCANGSLTDPVQPTYCNAPDLGVSQWVNGNVGASKAHYYEGDSLPYRIVFGGLTVGSTNTVTIEWDTLKSGKHALDYLTTYNRTVTTANPCAGITGCDAFGVSTAPIPAQPNLDPGMTQIPGVFTMFGATITNVSAITINAGADAPAAVTITFIANVENPVLAWAAHIATRADWGLDASAVSIPGSPYHTRLLDLNGSGGNQDRSLSADAVIFPGSVTVIKDAQPNATDDFAFSATGGLTPSSFTLDDDPLTSPPTNTQVFSGLTDFTSKTVTEGAAFGWTLASITCQVTSANGGSTQTNLGTRTATIDIKEGENWTCTFVNTRNQPSISTVASTTGTVGSAISDTATLSGLVDPSGTRYIVFRAYGPGDATCTGTPAFTSAQIPVTGNGEYSSGNFTPTLAGTYLWIASYSGDANNAPVSGACGDPNETTTVGKDSPSISTSATASVAIGSSISDTATLSGGTAPTGTIVFRIYGPDNATCTGDGVVVSTETVSGNGDYTSDNYTPTQAGTYRWRAFYSGDANNNAVSGACNDAGETTTVTKRSPTIATTATANVAIGGSISDSATLSGEYNPTNGTVTFNLYGPDNATCTGTPVFTSTVAIASNGTATSASFTPSVAGTYRWIASYSGDANNNAVTGACNDTGETSVVGKDAPSIATQATSGTVGTPIHDVATLSDGTAPTGTIVFRIYGPNDATCATAGTLVSTETVTGNGDYASDDFTPTQTGTYRWRAFYSGDVNNDAVSGPCNAAGETSTVDKDSPAIATQATSATIGGTIHDVATLSGGYNPTGTIVFRVYGPDNATCSGDGTLVSTETVTGNGDYTSDDFTPTQAGTYRWRAFYSGDGNNDAVSGPCNAAGETSTVDKDSPAIATTAVGGSVGFAISDSATLSGGYSPTGTITFRLYGPSDPTCAGTPVYTDVVTVTGNGTYGSGDYTPTQAGAYRWIASYSGDVNNDPASGSCGDEGETSTVLAPELNEDKAALNVSVDAGDDITFTMTTKNTGAGVAKDVTLNDPLPDGVDWSIVSQTNAGECSITGAGNDQVLSCSYGNLASGAQRVVTVKATTSFEACTVYNNTATASADNAPSDSDDAQITCNKPSVSIDKSTSTGTINAGDVAKFAVKVSNGGPGAAKNVTVEDVLPAGPTWSADGALPAGCSIANVTVDGATRQKVTCTLASMASGASFTFNVQATTSQENCAVYNNTATGTGSNTGPIAPDSATVTCRKLPAISIDKTGPATATAGDRINYTLAVKNTGPTSYAEGLVVLTDVLCEAPPILVSKGGDASPATLDPGETWLYGCTVQTQVGQTVVNNIGVVNGTDVNGNKAAAQDGADTALSQPVVLGVSTPVVPGSAKLRGPSGCLLRPTQKVYVTGKQILSVRFVLDKKTLKTVTKPDSSGRYAVTITRNKIKLGSHRVQAIVTFRAASKTKPRTLQLRFSRCGEVKPARAKGFTG